MGTLVSKVILAGGLTVCVGAGSKPARRLPVTETGQVWNLPLQLIFAENSYGANSQQRTRCPLPVAKSSGSQSAQRARTDSVTRLQRP